MDNGTSLAAAGRRRHGMLSVTRSWPALVAPLPEQGPAMPLVPPAPVHTAAFLPQQPASPPRSQGRASRGALKEAPKAPPIMRTGDVNMVSVRSKRSLPSCTCPQQYNHPDNPINMYSSSTNSTQLVH